MVSEHLTSQRSSMATSSSDSSSSSTTIPSPEFTALAFTLPNSTSLNIVKLDGPNYLDWVSQFLPILRCNDLLGIVDGSEPCPPKTLTNAETQEQQPNPAYVLWQKRDQQLLSWIICSLTPSLVSSMYGLNTSYSAWTTLATRFASQSKSRISHLKRQLQNLQQGSKTCTEYLNTAKKWADQLAAGGKPVDDDDLISFITSGLNPAFNSFVTIFNFSCRDKEMSFLDFQAELLSHEILLENQQQHSITPETGSFALYTNKSPNTSFHTAHPNSTRTPFVPSNRKPKFTPRSHPSPKFSPHVSNNTNSHQGNFGPRQGGSQFPTQQGTRTSCQICGKPNHSALDCYHRMDYAYQGRHPPTQLAAMMVHTNADLGTQDWLADSGANTHITVDPNTINNPVPFEGNETVGVGNGTGLNITATGSTLVNSNLANSSSKFLLKDILLCPSASANLLSINKFCIDNHCMFELTGSSFTVKDTLTGTVLLQGPSENGLYPIPLHRISQNKLKGFAALLGVKTTDMVWHQRLGHPSIAVFQHLLSHQHLPLAGSVDKLRICESCQLGKSKQLPFCESSRQTFVPLELVHSDVWTSPIPSLTGCKFYVIFVDDYSRFTWLYPMFNKSDVYQCFLKFKALVEKQFNTPIKQFQSDNGGEYTSNQFKLYLSQNGIFHRLTCPHTSQQNGIAERKHRHIVELGLTLLAQLGLPSKHWVDSFLTSVYLINRLPTPVLKNASPFSKLFGTPPKYSALKSFGCLCFPLLRPYTTHKLSFRSKPCIFIGYCASQRGYRCFDPQSQKIYISRHVVFDESRFPAKDTTLSQSPCKLTASPGTSLIPLLTISSTPQNSESCLNSQINSQTPSTQQSQSADHQID
jgi:hypothetical protein